MNLEQLTFFDFTLMALLGLMTGSFMNVVIVRYPKLLAEQWQKEAHSYLNLIPPNGPRFNLAIPRSHCPHCQHLLVWYDLLPILSFLWLKGKCRHCQQKISWQYPVVELLSAALWVLISFKFGLNLQALILIVVSEILLVLALIDLNTQLLPDNFTLSLLWLALLCSALKPYLASATEAILGAAIAYSVWWSVNFIYRKLRKREGMGYGDFKCFAALGAWLGLHAVPCLFLLAVILGLLFNLISFALKKIRFNQNFPFGPAIILAGWVLLIWPNECLKYFNELFHT